MLDKLPKDAKVQLQIKSESKIEAVIIKEKTVIKPFVSLLVKRQYVNCLFILNENI